MATKNSTASKPTPKTPTTSTKAKEKPTLEEMASDENTGISRVLAELENSNEFLATIGALEYSPMYEHLRAALNLPKGFDSLDVDMFAARMYLAGRLDQRGEPSKE